MKVRQIHRVRHVRALFNSDAMPIPTGSSEATIAAHDADIGLGAAGIVYLTNGYVLLLMRAASASSNPSTWGFPAGGIEEGESAAQAAVRESVEETHHVPSVIDLLAEDGSFTLYLCQGDVFAPVLNDEHSGYLWAHIDSLPTPLHPRVAEQVAMAWAKTQEPAEPVIAADAVDGFAMDDLCDLVDGTGMDKSAREMDTNGWYEVQRNPISKVGVFTYSAKQVGKEEETPGKQYRVLRPPEELSDPETLASFRLLPWIDNHVMLGDEAKGLMPAERKGIQGVTGERIVFEGDTVFSNLKVLSQSMAGLIEAGKRELSCGYRCVYDFTPGVFQGEAYDCIQRTIRGNHLALVHSGRMGPDVAVLDSIDHSTTTDTKEPPMAEDKSGGGSALDAALATLKTATPEARKAHMTALRAVMDEAGDKPDMDDDKKAKEAADAAEEEAKKKADEKAAQDAEEEEAKKKAAEAKDADLKADDIAKRPNAMDAMDAAAVSKLVAAELARAVASTKRRDVLAKQLGQHIGTFDHSDMTEAQVAAYGAKKLGIAAEAGTEAAVLQGYLLAAGKTAPVAKTATAMDAGAADFVTAYLTKKEG